MIPALYTITFRTYSEGEPDRYGDVTPVWTDREIPVHGMAPGAQERSDGDRTSEEVAWTVYAPSGTVVSSKDSAIIDGREYQVIGQPADWSRSPFPFGDAGVVIELRNQEG